MSVIYAEQFDCFDVESNWCVSDYSQRSDPGKEAEQLTPPAGLLSRAAYPPTLSRNFLLWSLIRVTADQATQIHEVECSHEGYYKSN